MRNEKCFSFKNGDNYVYKNTYAKSGIVKDNEDMSKEFTYDLFEMDFPNQPKDLLKINNDILVSSLTLEVPKISKEMLDEIFDDIKSLPGEKYEIWDQKHNVEDDIHTPDPKGNASRLFDILSENLELKELPVNHNKVSSKPEDRMGLNHFHIDSFEGMRTDENGKRKKIDRYFFNLGEKDRDFCIVPIDPKLVEKNIPLEYSNCFLDDFMEELDWHLPIIKIRTPGINLKTKTINVLKVRSTHVLHGEYGEKDDLLAIINTAVD